MNMNIKKAIGIGVAALTFVGTLEPPLLPRWLGIRVIIPVFIRVFIITAMAGRRLARNGHDRNRCTRLWLRDASDASVRPVR
jgi:hypothetical protein